MLWLLGPILAARKGSTTHYGSVYSLPVKMNEGHDAAAAAAPHDDAINSP